MASAGAIFGPGTYLGLAVRRAAQRLGGTIGGLAIATAVLAVNPQDYVLAATLGALQVLIQLTVTRHYATAMLFVTPLALLLASGASGSASAEHLTGDRLVETAIGAGATLVAAQLISPGWARRPKTFQG